jgi:hypothetical protein
MSTAARDEAIEIVADVFGEVIEEVEPKYLSTNVATLVAAGEYRGAAEIVVDKLLETHSISRNAPRVHRASDPEHPRQQVRLAGRSPV